MIALQIAQLEKSAAKGLCLEFILHEYCKSSRKSISSPSRIAIRFPINFLEKLLSDSLNVEALLQPGVLDKLCFYCEALVQTSKTAEPILQALDEIRSAVSLCRTALSRQFRGDPISPSRKGSNESISAKLKAFFSSLSPILSESLECEAALFSLVELRKTFNRHLGENTVENLLQSMFPAGPDHFRATIESGFAKRGFSNYPERSQLFEGLTWQEVEISKRP